MALADYSAYRASPVWSRAQLGKATLVVVSGRLYSRWLSAPLGGAVPTVSVAPNAALLGAAPHSPTGLATWIKSAQMARTSGGVLTIYDRLAHQGGLSGIVTTPQAVPSAPLTRYTSGAGVLMAFEIYTAVGTTATVLSVSYTNSAGVAGRVSPDTTFGGTGNNAVGRFQILPFQAGDSGVRSVESVTVAVSTGTAGNFGITLFKPLLALPCYPLSESANFDTVRDLGAAFESVEPDACLAQLYAGGALVANTTLLTAGVLNLVKQ